ncbi:MAG TPA: type VI secretion system-associated protein TagF [Albitalea sp.]
MIALAVENVAAAVPGWFGKLACLGDFASRRLPGDFMRACDGWLSSGIETSRVQLGERWLDTYLTSPVWRFAWAPGVVDAQWWFGVLMPSVDNVGRYFPLLVALPREQAPHDGEALARLEQWFDEVSDAALATLHPGATLARFEAALHAAVPLPDTASPLPLGYQPEELQWINRSAWRFQPGRSLREGLLDLVHEEATRRALGRTLWWPQRARAGENRLTVVSGLPAAESFGELLQGAW